MMKPKEINVIKTIKLLLELLLQPALNQVGVKLKKNERLELKGENGTKVILKLLVPMDQLDPQAQQMIKMLKVKKFTDS